VSTAVHLTHRKRKRKAHGASGRVRIAGCLAVGLSLGGCMLMGPNFQRPDVKLPAGYAESTENATSPLLVPANWWRLYGDEALDKLVDAGLQQNVDVRHAIARIQEAEALVREANAAIFFPEIDGNVAAGRARSSTATGSLPLLTAPIRNNFQLAASTSFELDFWGRLRRIREAAIAQYAASRYARDVVSLSLAAGITQAYFNVRSLDAQIVVSEESLKSAADGLDIAKRRAEAGLVSDLDVNQAGAIYTQLGAQITDLKRQRALAVHQLGVLTGALDVTVAPGDLRRIPIPPLAPAGLPSTLLERRPDLREAEETFRSANAQIGAFRAAQFPTFSLTGALGTQSRELSTLFSTGAGIWSIGVNAVGPLFDAGRSAARTDQAIARARQAAADYEKTAQTAFREVSDALSNVRLAADTEQDLAQRVEYARNSLRLATMRYESGYSAYLEVLDAQRTLNDAQLALVRNRQAFLGFTVDLMNALGGGWVPDAAAPDAVRNAVGGTGPTDSVASTVR
jgi:outer membrane protein, multidrug efflux system